ncbi:MULTISPECIES: HipA N-terminal domain-containing protein [Aeromonas]|uniref:HipA N-terminal domain-containing protein n=1 Tax=Aeromonas TaxID=642 RepID=UPI000F546A45|nr:MULTISPECIES: HipA N-terminal domain-containing protein [Aeromonas]RQM70420.1 type II toxin-antitoxin system HipA family toxin [Aeromonas jandaei]UBH27749.1 HipA N-terminal domain-containing protein [Aeromonas enteropelogenes]
MRRQVEVYLYGKHIGLLRQNDDGYLFEYNNGYMGPPLSLSFPVNQGRFYSDSLHPYFASLAPEGWLRKRYSQLQQLDENDLFGILIQNGKNLIGAVQLIVENEV